MPLSIQEIREISTQAANAAVRGAAAEFKKVAEEAGASAAHQVVAEMFLRMGMDPDDGETIRQTFHGIRIPTMVEAEERIQDRLFVRRLRTQMQSMSTRIGYVVITIFITAIGALIAFGLRAWFGVFPPPS